MNIKHFRYLLEGRIFIVYTDHKPLIFALTSKTERSPRQTRHLEYISQFTSDIRHISGDTNIVADTLSRTFEVEEYKVTDLNKKTLFEEQQRDKVLQEIISDKSKIKN